MTEKKELGEEYLAYENDGQKVYILPNSTAVEQLIKNLSSLDGQGEGEFSQKRVWQKPDSAEGGQQADLLKEMAARLQGVSSDGSVVSPAAIRQKVVDQLLGEENQGVNIGEQKIYVLPDMAAAEQLLKGLANNSGEFTQSRMWNKANLTNFAELMERLQVIEAKMQQVEQALTTSVDQATSDESSDGEK